MRIVLEWGCYNGTDSQHCDNAAESAAKGEQNAVFSALAVELDISYNTVNRAYMDLEREGYISTRKGRGTFVAERHAVDAARATDTPVELLIDDMIQARLNAGLTESDIISMVDARLDRRRYM